jgi:hypothetical protein
MQICDFAPEDRPGHCSRRSLEGLPCIFPLKAKPQRKNVILNLGPFRRRSFDQRIFTFKQMAHVFERRSRFKSRDYIWHVISRPFGFANEFFPDIYKKINCIHISFTADRPNNCKAWDVLINQDFLSLSGQRFNEVLIHPSGQPIALSISLSFIRLAAEADFGADALSTYRL